MNEHTPAGPTLSPRTASRWPAHLGRIAAIALGLAFAALFVIRGSDAAFTATTDNNTNQLASGTVVLSDDDAGTKLFDVSGLNGGQSLTKCINVTYTGSLAADVKLYGVVGGTGLAPGLTTTVDIGTGATGGSSFSCANFVQDDAGTEFTGTLATFGTNHTNYGNGVGEYLNATNPTTKSYRIIVTVSNDNTYQGKNATASFTWEAQGKDA